MARSTSTYQRAVILGLQQDLVRGLIAGLLLLLVLALGASLWLALPISMIAYGGMRLMAGSTNHTPSTDSVNHRPRTGRDALALCQTLRPSITMLSFGLDDGRPAAQITRVLCRTDQLIAAIEEDKQFDAAPMLLDLMETMIELLTPYAKAIRRGLDGYDVQESLLRDLAILERALDLLWEKVNQETLASLSAISEMIEFNLEGIATLRQDGDRR
jgi:HAMP domain-containing protein